MNCYFDSSVIIRKLFGENHPLAQWKKIKIGFSSRLLKLECLRTIDRLRLKSSISNEDTSECLAGLHETLSRIALLPITESVIEKAEQSLPTPLASLDSIHLATALLWREKQGKDFLFATHDELLALAAKAHGLEVIGV